AAIAACSHPQAPPPAPPAPPAQPAPPPPPTARWVDARGATEIAAELPGGTLVLVGGRRALVTRAGAVIAARAPRAEPLEQLVAVPTAAGPRVAGRGASNVLYRFDDPLGPGVALSLVQRWPSLADVSIAPGPGVLAVRVGPRVKLV